MQLVVGLVLVAACGGGAPRADAPESVGARCGATCEEVDLRGPLAAAGVGEEAVAVAARRADGRVVIGVARTAGGAWDATSLRFRPLGDGPARAVALAPRGEVAVLAVADDGGVTLYEVDGDGDVDELARADGAVAARIDLAVREDGLALVGLVAPDGAAHVLALGPEGTEALPIAPEGAIRDLAVAFDGDVPVAAGATPDGVVARWPEAELRIAGGPAQEVAMASGREALVVGWAEDDGVRVARVRRGELREPARSVDDGSRPGEPAHRVGAALTIRSGGASIAYQDQTAGALVVVEERPTGYARRDVTSPDLTRGMHVAIARAGGASFVLDLGARAAQQVRMIPHVTRMPEPAPRGKAR